MHPTYKYPNTKQLINRETQGAFQRWASWDQCLPSPAGPGQAPRAQSSRPCSARPTLSSCNQVASQPLRLRLRLGPGLRLGLSPAPLLCAPTLTGQGRSHQLGWAAEAANTPAPCWPGAASQGGALCLWARGCRLQERGRAAFLRARGHPPHPLSCLPARQAGLSQTRPGRAEP